MRRGCECVVLFSRTHNLLNVRAFTTNGTKWVLVGAGMALYVYRYFVSILENISLSAVSKYHSTSAQHTPLRLPDPYIR